MHPAPFNYRYIYTVQVHMQHEIAKVSCTWPMLLVESDQPENRAVTIEPQSEAHCTCFTLFYYRLYI